MPWSGPTAIREVAHVAAIDAAAAETPLSKLTDKQALDAEEPTRIEALEVMTDRDVVRRMPVKQMDEQFDAFPPRDKKVLIKARVKNEILR